MTARSSLEPAHFESDNVPEKIPKVVGLENSFFHRITALETEEVGTCNISCDGRDEAPSVVSLSKD